MKVIANITMNARNNGVKFPLVKGKEVESTVVEALGDKYLEFLKENKYVTIVKDTNEDIVNEELTDIDEGNDDTKEPETNENTDETTENNTNENTDTDNQDENNLIVVEIDGEEYELTEEEYQEYLASLEAEENEDTTEVADEPEIVEDVIEEPKETKTKSKSTKKTSKRRTSKNTKKL